jgi:hypothetical protein
MVVALEVLTVTVAVAFFAFAVVAASQAWSLTAAFVAACLVGGAWILDRTRREM